jgi:hypothetical protein
MKKIILAFSLTMILILGSLNMAVAQQQPKPKKDTVNMDSNAKPTYYYPVEDEKKGKGPVAIIAIIAGAVVLIGAGAFIVLRKKK